MSKAKGRVRQRAKKKERNQNKNSYFLRKKSLLLKIRKWNDPILKEVCSLVDPSEDISGIVKEMRDILIVSNNGLGLAAPQAGYAKRIFITRPSITSHSITVFINASIISESEEREKRGEGCLSYPGIITVIDRPAEITVEYKDEKFEVQTKKFKGLDACVVCHEYDHTIGVCLVGDSWKEEQDGETIPEDVSREG